MTSKPLTIVHVLEDLSDDGGGVAVAVAELMNALTAWGVNSVAVFPRRPEARLSRVRTEVALHACPAARGTTLWGYGSGLKRTLSEVAATADVIHIHGIWMAPQLMGCRAALRFGVPCVLSPHNMLSPELWGDTAVKRLKKDIYWKIARRWLTRVEKVHALSATESATLGQRFDARRIVVLPNGIADEAFCSTERVGRQPAERGYVLYLGRLVENKGLEELLVGWSMLNQPAQLGSTLRIAGPGARSYVDRLKKLTRDLGMEGRVVFSGPHHGSEKMRLVQEAWAVCLPSRSEGTSMVALEAGTQGTPVIGTSALGLDDFPNRGGVLVERTSKSVARGLAQCLGWTRSERRERGLELQRYVRENFAWSRLAPRYISDYESLLGA